VEGAKEEGAALVVTAAVCTVIFSGDLAAIAEDADVAVGDLSTINQRPVINTTITSATIPNKPAMTYHSQGRGSASLAKAKGRCWVFRSGTGALFFRSSSARLRASNINDIELRPLCI